MLINNLNFFDDKLSNDKLFKLKCEFNRYYNDKFREVLWCNIWMPASEWLYFEGDYENEFKAWLENKFSSILK